MYEALSRAFRADGALRFSTLGVLGIAVLYLVSLFAGVEIIDWYEGSLLTLPLVFWAFQYRLREITRAGERRFWTLFSWSFSSWILAGILQIFFPRFSATAPGLLLEDVFYLLFYLLFLFAVESHPHRVIPDAVSEVWQERHRFETEGAVLLALGLLIYFTLIPMLTDMGGYSTYFPSGCLYVTLGAVIVARSIYAYRLARSARWRITYRLVIVAALGMLATDIFDTLTFVPGNWFVYDVYTVPPVIYTFWYLYLLPLIWAARLRHFLPADEEPAAKVDVDRQRADLPFSNILLLYAVLLPVLHLVFQSLEYLGAVHWRALSVLFYLVAFAQLIRRQQKFELARSRHLEREREQLERQRERFIAELESKNAELEQFTYTVSHDLKSPLVTISGFLGLMKQDILSGRTERAAADLDRINAAARQMSRLLDDLLELSRIGRFVNVPEEVSANELAREALAMVEGLIRERGVEVVVASDLPAVYGDRQRLLEVFQNLLENAVKFMGSQTEPRIEVSARVENGESVFRIADNGVGIAPEYHDKIFDLFHRLDPAIDGTGVGLALVKRIVELHDGRIWVESEGAGKGSSVCFVLPGSA